MRQDFLWGLGVHGFHRLAYTEWGDPANPRVLVCVHGLSRNGRDFDRLAASFADGWRVICPDMPGRGDSGWLPDGGDYAMPTYMADCAALIARLGVSQVAWLGTSMGGIIGLYLAAAANSPITRLAINDIGPFIPAAGLARIGEAIGGDPHFADLDEAELFLRQAMAAFGIERDDYWRELTRTSVRPAAEGGFRLHYDPAIGEPFRQATADEISFWPVWDAVRCPTLVLRGGQSDILLAETARQMVERRPAARLVEFAHCGHAPALMEETQIEIIRRWFDEAP